jgi:hypothetical protein
MANSPCAVDGAGGRERVRMAKIKTYYNPEPGKFDIQDKFLTNIPAGQSRPPYNQPWEYILWGRHKSNKHRVQIVLIGNTKREVDSRLFDLAEKAEIY